MHKIHFWKARVDFPSCRNYIPCAKPNNHNVLYMLLQKISSETKQKPHPSKVKCIEERINRSNVIIKCLAFEACDELPLVFYFLSCFYFILIVTIIKKDQTLSLSGVQIWSPDCVSGPPGFLASSLQTAPAFACMKRSTVSVCVCESNPTEESSISHKGHTDNVNADTLQRSMLPGIHLFVLKFLFHTHPYVLREGGSTFSFQGSRASVKTRVLSPTFKAFSHPEPTLKHPDTGNMFFDFIKITLRFRRKDPWRRFSPPPIRAPRHQTEEATTPTH